MEQKWVTRGLPLFWVSCYSTNERRLVIVDNGSPIEVIPVGRYKAWFSKYATALVSMGPKQIDLNLKGNAGTSDGIAVEGKVSVQVIIRDEESCIKRIAADPDEEERLLGDSILTAVQETIASRTWHLMMSIGEGFAQTVEQKLTELLHRTGSCFAVKSLTIKEIRPQNKAFAESLEKAARAKEEEKLQRDLAELKAERAALERKAKEEELASELEMQKLRHQHELEAERERLELQLEKDDVQISTQKKLSELLETVAGRIAVFPKEMFGYLLKEIEVKITDEKERQKLYREFLRSSQSFQAGQFNAMKALLAQHFGFRLSEEVPEEVPMLPTEKDSQTDN